MSDAAGQETRMKPLDKSRLAGVRLICMVSRLAAVWRTWGRLRNISADLRRISPGTARLGLRSAVIRQVGDEHMGASSASSFCARASMCAASKPPTRAADRAGLLGIRDEGSSADLYRENCADMALSEGTISTKVHRRGAAVLATGTHLSIPRTAAAVLKALELARKHGADGAGYRLSPEPLGRGGAWRRRKPLCRKRGGPAKLQATLHLFDLIVGTEKSSTSPAARPTHVRRCAVRAVSDARWSASGAQGAVAFTGAIPTAWTMADRPRFPDRGLQRAGRGRRVLSGLMKGWRGCGLADGL